MISSYTGVVENAASTSAAAVEAKKKTEQTQNEKSGSVSGKTIGSPKLSKKTADYYESLKKKYSNMDFILVSEDKKEQAKAQASSYANASKMVVERFGCIKISAMGTSSKTASTIRKRAVLSRSLYSEISFAVNIIKSIFVSSEG